MLDFSLHTALYLNALVSSELYFPHRERLIPSLTVTAPADGASPTPAVTNPFT